MKILMVGVRFEAGAEVRNGAGNTIVVEDIPISGPIWYVTGFEDGQSLAECARCGRQSPMRKRAPLGGVIQQWAHKHRCTFKKQATTNVVE
jgi:hypothetical protein